MFNRRGQIGKIVASFPVIIIVIILMGLFVFLSFGFSIVEPCGGAGISRSIDNSILFEEIEVSGENLSVLNGLIGIRNAELERADINFALSNRKVRDDRTITEEEVETLLEELDGITDEYEENMKRAVYTSEVRTGIISKLEKDSKGIERDFCFIVLESNKVDKFIFPASASELGRGSMFLIANNGEVRNFEVVPEVFGSEIVDLANDYDRKGFLSRVVFDVRLPYELEYLPSLGIASLSTQIQNANTFALYSYYGPCKSKEELE